MRWVLSNTGQIPSRAGPSFLTARSPGCDGFQPLPVKGSQLLRAASVRRHSLLNLHLQKLQQQFSSQIMITEGPSQHQSSWGFGSVLCRTFIAQLSLWLISLPLLPKHCLINLYLKVCIPWLWPAAVDNKIMYLLSTYLAVIKYPSSFLCRSRTFVMVCLVICEALDL